MDIIGTWDTSANNTLPWPNGASLIMWIWPIKMLYIYMYMYIISPLFFLFLLANIFPFFLRTTLFNENFLLTDQTHSRMTVQTPTTDMIVRWEIRVNSSANSKWAVYIDGRPNHHIINLCILWEILQLIIFYQYNSEISQFTKKKW